MLGKKLRLKRFLYPHSTRGLIVPIDHGLTVGPLPGVQSTRGIQSWIHHPAIRGVIAHKGIAERLIEADALNGVGLMIHLNGMSTLGSQPDTKHRLTSLETALALGADGVSFQVNFDGENDPQNLQTMGTIVDEAARYSLPVLAMIYDKVPTDDAKAIGRLRHLIRIAIELGCDAVKIGQPRQLADLPTLLRDLSEDIPVFLAGGAVSKVEELMDLTRAGLRAGARGLCVGRNVFQRPDAAETLDRLQQILDPQPLALPEREIAQGVAYGAH